MDSVTAPPSSSTHLPPHQAGLIEARLTAIQDVARDTKLYTFARPAAAPARARAEIGERGAPFSTAGFLRLVQRAGEAAKLGFPVHPHMLRHAAGFKLDNDGVEYQTAAGVLGPQIDQQHRSLHRAIADTVQRFWRR